MKAAAELGWCVPTCSLSNKVVAEFPQGLECELLQQPNPFAVVVVLVLTSQSLTHSFTLVQLLVGTDIGPGGMCSSSSRGG